MNSNKARLRSIYGEMVNKPDLKDIEGFTTVTIEDIKLKDIEELPLKWGTVCYFDTEYTDDGMINLVINWRTHYDY